MKKLMVLPMFALAALVSCGQSAKESEKTVALDLTNMDSTVVPGEDFYQHAAGGWIKKNPLKPEYSRFAVFDQLAENNKKQLRTLIDELNSSEQPSGSVAQKIATLYSVGLDSVQLNKQGFDPIKEELAAIQSLTSKDDITRMTAQLHKEAIFPYFIFFVGADEKNSSMNIFHLYQGGLGLGDRDYYLSDDENSVKIRTAYQKYIKELFAKTGKSADEAEAAAAAIIKIETSIAKVVMPREFLRDSKKNYNKMSVDEFITNDDFINWKLYFSELGLKDLKELDVKQVEVYKGLNNLFKNVSIEDQKLYLSFNLLDAASSYLSDEFVNINFDFYGKVLSGRQELQPRWKRSLSVVNGALGEAVGQMYVAKYFPASSKEKMIELVGNLQKALGERISNLEWMSEATKAKAHEKLNAFTVKIGYPDKWRDYSGLEIKNDSYWANVKRSNIFDIEYMLSDQGKPVDKTRWGMSPQTVNAYYNPTTNEICFPAAILQPPFFNPDADDAVNYGAIGVVIGHEMTHGFDDSGRNYDKEGNLADWWTEEDAEKFNKRAERLVEQFNQIIVIDTVHANGRYTLGENIADHGGLLIAHQAYTNTLKGKAVPEPIDGLTNEQRFYLSYGGLWAQNARDEEILRLTKMDVHSIGKWRVNATLRNIDDFYKAFNIKQGDKMFMAPEDRVVIW